MRVLEIEILRKAGFLGREPEVTVKDSRVYKYLLEGLEVEELLKLRRKFLGMIRKKGLVEAVRNYLLYNY